MPSLVTTKFKIHNAEQFIESLDETNATNLYLFVGRVEDWDSDGGDFDEKNAHISSSLFFSDLWITIPISTYV